MINLYLIKLLLALLISIGINSLYFVKKSERSIEINQWITMLLTFIFIDKLTPILSTPSLMLRPIELLFVQSGEMGLILATIGTFFYWIISQLRNHRNSLVSWTYLLNLLIIFYTLHSVFEWEVYIGRPIGLFILIVGVITLGLIKKWPRLYKLIITFYSGTLILIESLGFVHIYFGFSLIQWLVLGMIFIYYLFEYVEKRWYTK